MEIINSFFGMILNVIFEIVSNITPVGTLGLTIIIFTLVAQLLLTPLKMKQQHTTRAMSRIQPDLQRLQKKYANKKDQASQMEYSKEMQALYKKHKASPLSGCLPLIIQLPLIYALYNVLRQPSRYIDKLGDLYAQLATTMEQQVANIDMVIQKVIEQVPLSSTATIELNRLGEAAGLSDTLSHFTTAQWETLQTLMAPENYNALSGLLEQKHNYEWFLVNLVDSPAQLVASGIVLALLVPLIAGASTFIFSKITMASTRANQPAPTDGAANSTESMMKVMNIMMPIMMGTFSYSVPTGLALYWVSGNIIMMFQQVIVNKMVDKKEAILDEKFRLEREAEAKAQPKKKKKKKRPPVEGQAVQETPELSEHNQEQQRSDAKKVQKSKNTNQNE